MLGEAGPHGVCLSVYLLCGLGKQEEPRAEVMVAWARMGP